VREEVTFGIPFASTQPVTLPHHSLIAWQRADDLFIVLHGISQRFPTTERFELAAQLRRAAFSVAVNIVEGFGRQPGLDRLHFLQIALASLAEVGYCLHVARRLRYVGSADYERLETEVRRTAAPLRGLMKSAGREHP
jgi:four helix bundle protein